MRVVVVFDVAIAHGLTFLDIFPHLSFASALFGKEGNSSCETSMFGHENNSCRLMAAIGR